MTYKRLINLNKHVENLFKIKSKEISNLNPKIKNMIKKKLNKNAKKIDKFLIKFFKKTKKIFTSCSNEIWSNFWR